MWLTIARLKEIASKSDRLLRRMACTILLGMTIFDALNFLHVVPYKVEFTLFGRIVSTGGVLIILYLIDKAFRKEFKHSLPGIVWLAAVIIVINDFIGDVFHLYGRWQHYDDIVHFLSGPLLVASVAAVVKIIARRKQWIMPSRVIYLLALGVDGLIAILYEVEEYLEDFFTLSHRLGDGPDTANDLMVNLIGGACLLLVIYLVKKLLLRAEAEQTLSTPTSVASLPK